MLLPVNRDDKFARRVPFDTDLDRERGGRRFAQPEQREGDQPGDNQEPPRVRPRSQPWRPPRQT